MKKIYFLAFVLIISCTKSNNDLETKSLGIFEEFITKDNEITVVPIHRGNLDYSGHANPTSRGFYFSPLVDIELTAIGGLMAKTGDYKIEIIEISEFWALSLNDPIILTQNITITNINEFQFTELDNELLLHSNRNYVIKYFDENHDSVYDVLLPNSYNNGLLLQPKQIKDIELEMMYYAYYYEIDGELYISDEGGSQHSILFLRGIIDFKYHIKE